MQSIQVASIALAALTFAGTAQSADVKAPAYKSPPIHAAPSSWTGFYAGLGLGFRATRSEIEALSETAGSISMNPIDFASLTKTLPFDGTGFRASTYAGFNWQFAPRWILGAEGDFGFSDQTTTIAGFSFSSIFGDTSRAADGLAVNSKWDASLRGRGGLLISPATLAYVTGGVAWQHFKAVSTCTSIFCVTREFSPAVVTKSITRTGWTVGAGIETALWGHWLARAEYRYANFGSAPFIIARSQADPVFNPTVDTTTVSMQSHTATFGMAYKFGSPATGEDPGSAFAAAQSAVVVWTGPYAGLGVGTRSSRTDATTVSATEAGVPINLNGRAISQPIDGTAFRISPYAGFNWQIGPQWVVGIEGDTGLASQTATLPGFAFSPAISVTEDIPDRLSVKTTWDASLRGRLGYLPTPATLAYVTSGLAWQRYEVTSVCAGPSVCDFFARTPVTITNAITKTGWTIGGGLETALWTNWLVRGEYRYADFGTSSFTLVRSSRSDFPQFNPTIATFDVKLRTHAVTFGLAYKFN
jgi:outer membrane immunogenic protein